MAFKSIGQKYGFVSAGDVFRQRIAAAEAKAESERRKAEAELAQSRDDTKTVLRNMGLSEAQIADACSQLDALRQSRLSKG